MPTHSVKIAIELKDNPISKKSGYQILKDIQKIERVACNKAIILQYEELMRKEEAKRIGEEVIPEKEIYGSSFMAYVERRMKEIMVGCLTSNVAQTRAFAMNKANFNKAKILKGEESLSQFKMNIPIIIHNKAYTIYQDREGRYYLEVGLLNREKQEEIGIKRFRFILIKPDASIKAILNRLMCGKYKMGTGQITYNERKKKWMFTIAYSFEAKEKLEGMKVLGVDLGITNAATMSIYDVEKGEYERLRYQESVMDGKELIHYRQKYEGRRRSLSRAKKWASDNKVGHGYKQRMKDINIISDKIARFRDTVNHKYSRYIVNLAVKHECSLIQLEDLSGFSNQQENNFLKNWSYYDLQEKIIYKAEEKGIVVKTINPKYTSLRCHKCGCINKENRDCKNNQEKFECVQCGYKENADINASKNIAIPNIEEIIEEYMKSKK